jgi:hypothetical protein
MTPLANPLDNCIVGRGRALFLRCAQQQPWLCLPRLHSFDGQDGELPHAGLGICMGQRWVEAPVAAAAPSSKSLRMAR